MTTGGAGHVVDPAVLVLLWPPAEVAPVPKAESQLDARLPAQRVGPRHAWPTARPRTRASPQRSPRAVWSRAATSGRTGGYTRLPSPSEPQGCVARQEPRCATIGSRAWDGDAPTRLGCRVPTLLSLLPTDSIPSRRTQPQRYRSPVDAADPRSGGCMVVRPARGSWIRDVWRIPR